MREGWKEVTIGELGQVVTGNTPPKNDPSNYGGEYPFIKPTDMEIGRRYCTNWEENYSEKAFKRYKNSFIPPKSTGVVTIGTVGDKLFQADRWCFTNQSVNVIIPNTALYDEDFIYYLMKINLPKVENANPGTASGRHHVSKSNFCAIKVRVPENKKTQQRIAEILSGYDDLIENNLKRIKILEEMAQQTYEEWFVRMRFPGHESAVINPTTGLPEGWEKGTLNSVTKYLSGYAFKSALFKEVGNGVIRIKNIGNNTIDLTDVAYIDDVYSDKQSKFLLNAGDLLIAMTGATVGKVGIMPQSDKKFYLNQRVGKFVTENTAFLNCFFNSTYGINQVINIAGGAAQPNISAQQILDIELIVPEKKILKLFSDNFNKNIETIINLQSQNQRLREARDILLPRLMMGMIEV